MTIREAIERLEALRLESPLGEGTVLAVCLLDSELPYVEVKDIRLERSDDGALVVIDAPEPR
jgi:hypothetical protein